MKTRGQSLKSNREYRRPQGGLSRWKRREGRILKILERELPSRRSRVIVRCLLKRYRSLKPSKIGQTKHVGDWQLRPRNWRRQPQIIKR